MNEDLTKLVEQYPELFGKDSVFGGQNEDHIFLQRFMRYLEATNREDVSAVHFVEYLEQNSDMEENDINAIKEKLEGPEDALPQFSKTLDKMGATRNPEFANKIYDNALEQAAPDSKKKKIAAAGAMLQDKTQEDIPPELLFGKIDLDVNGDVQIKEKETFKNMSQSTKIQELRGGTVTTETKGGINVRIKGKKKKARRTTEQKMNGATMQAPPPPMPNVTSSSSSTEPKSGLARVAKLASAFTVGGIGTILLGSSSETTETATSVIDILLK